VLRLVRSVSPAMMHDRSLARDIEAVHHLVESGEIGDVANHSIAELRALLLGQGRCDSGPP
jgi:histidine ammonia-lyase